MATPKKILITGGTGFVGHHLVEALLQENTTLGVVNDLHVTSLSDGRDFFWYDQIGGAPHVHQVDLTEATATTTLMQTLQPDEIYHLASIAQVGSSFTQARSVLTNNFALQLNLLEAVATHAPQARVLVISSGAIYDVTRAAHPPLINEDCPLGPNNPYAASKAIQDLMSQAYAASQRLNVVRARPFNHIGDYQGRGFAIPDFAAQIVAAKNQGGGEIKVGNLSPRRDFTDVKDVVAAYILLMRLGEVGAVYNVGSGHSLSMQEIVERLLALSGETNVNVVTDPDLVRSVDVPDIVADNARLAALGWQPQIPFEETLARVLAYWAKQLT
jgi:GDP-4-dehydro-6-deoxy-D-mannose reductase